MRFERIFYPFVCALLMVLMLLIARFWRVDKPAPAVPKPPRRKREPKPFAGYTCKPECELCEQGVESPRQRPDEPPRQRPDEPPPRMSFTRSRRRIVDTTGHFCPQPDCAYRGWVDWGNLRAHGHPNGRQSRQLVCLSCHGYFLETYGTLFHAKQVDPDKLVWSITALAEGVGIRAVARIFETDPNTVLTWLVEAAEHLEAFYTVSARELYIKRFLDRFDRVHEVRKARQRVQGSLGVVLDDRAHGV